jgi:hypothetical protein
MGLALFGRGKQPKLVGVLKRGQKRRARVVDWLATAKGRCVLPAFSRTATSAKVLCLLRLLLQQCRTVGFEDGG